MTQNKKKNWGLLIPPPAVVAEGLSSLEGEELDRAIAVLVGPSTPSEAAAYVFGCSPSRIREYRRVYTRATASEEV